MQALFALSLLFFIGTNNYMAGRLGGERVLQKLGGRGNVVFFTFAHQANTDERLQGFKDVFATRPEIHIVDVVDIKGETSKAFDWTQEAMALTGDKKVDAFISLESSSAKAVADALKRSSVPDRLVMAWDVDPDTLNAIKAGSIDSTVVQKPFTMAYYGLKALDEIYFAPPKQSARITAPTPSLPIRSSSIPALRWSTRPTWTITSPLPRNNPSSARCNPRNESGLCRQGYAL